MSDYFLFQSYLLSCFLLSVYFYFLLLQPARFPHNFVAWQLSLMVLLLLVIVRTEIPYNRFSLYLGMVRVFLFALEYHALLDADSPCSPCDEHGLVLLNWWFAETVRFNIVYLLQYNSKELKVCFSEHWIMAQGDLKLLEDSTNRYFRYYF